MTSPTPQRWSGDRLGLPQTGRGSLAKMPRRIVAICIDWAAAMLVSHAFYSDDSTATLIIFAAMQFVAILLLGASIGHWLSGLRLARLKGGRIGVWPALVRTLLLCLVIPVAVWDADSRGLHDKAAGTVLLRR